MTLGQYLEEQKITPAEFGRRVSRSRAAISRYVAGDRIPDRDTMVKIVTATQGAVTANDFYAPTSKRAA